MEEREECLQFNKLFIHPEFHKTLEDLNKIGVRNQEINNNIPVLSDLITTSGSHHVKAIEEMGVHDLDPKSKIIPETWTSIVAYDESIDNYLCLEGTSYFTSHCITMMGVEEYLASVYLTFYFYTKSSEIASRSKVVRLSVDPTMDSQKDYILDRISFLTENVPDNSILLIDGPIIAGDVYTYFIQAIERFHVKNILPVFFVKNSSSNLVTNYIPELKGKYNSDLHWAYNTLPSGARTNYFYYSDLNNSKNSKVFCYLKALNLSPQRVEVHSETFRLYRSVMDELMNYVYYLILVQGNKKNPQIRPIAVSEMYARDSLKLVNIQKALSQIGIIPTINQSRFGS